MAAFLSSTVKESPLRDIAGLLWYIITGRL
jgi:hypothetical protein